MNKAGATVAKGTFFAALFAIGSFAALAFAFSASVEDFEFGTRAKSQSQKSEEIEARKKAIEKRSVDEQKVTSPVNVKRDSERALLNAARSALTQMALGHATAKLAEHKRLYPEGTLQKEREALDVWRISLEGDERRTRAAAEAFLERYDAPSKERELVEALIN